VLGGHGLQGRAHGLGDGVALQAAFGLVHEVDRDFGFVLAVSLVIVADEAVEGHGRGRAGVDDGIGGLGTGQGHGGQLPAHGRGLLQGGAARHVHHHGKFALVVEGEHFHQHGLGRKKRARPKEQGHD